MPDTPSESTAPACGVCSAPTGDDASLCRTHTDDLRIMLAGGKVKTVEYLPVPVLVAELDITVTRQARTANTQDGGRSTERPLMWNENASAKAFELNATLNAWALDTSRIREDTRDQLKPVHHSDTVAVAEWLVRNLSTLRQHPEAGQAFDEIGNALREAHYAIDRAQDPVPFGQCGHKFEEGTVCVEVLYGQLDRPVIRCRACGSPHQVAERLEWMLQHVRGMLATLPELVAITRWSGKPASHDVLRLMARRERFEQVGRSPDGEPTFRVADVLKAIEDRGKHRPKPIAGAA
jgi:hypothetical protein